jgi:hypothetical protein
MSRVAKAGAPTVSVGDMLRLSNDRDYDNAAVRNDRLPEERISGEKAQHRRSRRSRHFNSLKPFNALPSLHLS